MKKFKLFALAMFAMLSTNTFAAVTEDATSLFKFTYDGENATIIGFVSTPDPALVKDLAIPATVLTSESTPVEKKVIAIGPRAFKDNTKIETLTIADENVATIYGGAFAGCTNLEAVTIGKKVVKISNEDNATTPVYVGGVFAGCKKLATVTFNTPAAAGASLAIDEETFEETIIQTLDLTTSNVAVVKKWFEDMNTTLTTVKLPASLTTIDVAAFKNLATLTTIDWTKCNTNAITINADAFSGAPLLKTLTLPATLGALNKNSLRGSNIQDLTIIASSTAGSPTIKEVGSTKLATLTISGNFVGIIGDDDYTKPAFANASLTTVTFTGTVAANAITKGAFTQATKLATVNFQGALAGGTTPAVKEGAFGDATTTTGIDHAGKSNNPASLTDPTKLTINYSPESTVTAVGFAPKAFGDDTNPVTVDYAKLVTTTAYAAIINALTGTNQIYNLSVSADAKKFYLSVTKGGSSSKYYAKLLSNKKFKIAKKQGEGSEQATVVVYQGYVDDSDDAIYMENLHIINGYYWIPANTPVIVKSDKEADVEMFEYPTTDLTTSEVGIAGAGSTNQITTCTPGGTLNPTGLANGDDATGLMVKDVYAAIAAGAQTPYFLVPFTNGYLWAKFKDERVLVGYTNGYYDEKAKTTTADFIVGCKNAPGARLNVVWLDGSEEEATAIQTVKKANAEKGAIYNLAGQKVNASYKGVVIKDGKKFIQK